MPLVEFAAHLRRHIDCPPQQVDARHLRAALDAALTRTPGLQHYVFDDQHALRTHVAVFINGERIQPNDLDRALADNDQVFVVQALSGG